MSKDKGDRKQSEAPQAGEEEKLEQESLWERYVHWSQQRRQRAEEKRKQKGPIRDWIETIVSVVLIVFVIRVVAVEAYRIPTGSMEDTLLIGDFLLVNKFVYGVRTPDWIGIPYTQIGFGIPHTRFPGPKDPKQGDVIVFRYPLDQRVNYIKRCVATGGQTVEIRDKVVLVDGEVFQLPPEGKYTDPYVLPRNIQMRHIVPRGAGNKDNYGPITVPEGYLFMMGDNRDNSADSRYWGFLDEDLVLGKAAIIYFSWDKFTPLHRFWNKVRWSRFLRVIH